jgi:hypothetical protein
VKRRKTIRECILEVLSDGVVRTATQITREAGSLPIDPKSRRQAPYVYGWELPSVSSQLKKMSDAGEIDRHPGFGPRGGWGYGKAP